MFLFATDSVIAYAAVVGVCLAIFGVKPSLSIWLLSPALFRWIGMPVLAAVAQLLFGFPPTLAARVDG